MKIHRLLEITTLLLNKSTMTAGELAERFEVSTRTIYRDIEALSAAGVPVYARNGHNGGIGIMEGYTIAKALISPEESESLIFALKTLQAAQYPNIDSVLNKLSGMFKNTPSYDWVDIDFSQWGSRPNENNRFLNIKDAILNRKVIEFDYVNSEGNRTRRSVEPMSIHFKGQAWYLWAYCRARQAFRIFRLSRIKKVVVTDEIFVRRPEEEGPVELNFRPQGQPVLLRVKFAPEALFRVYDDYGEQFITKNEDGSAEVCFPIYEDEWVLSYVFSFGSAAEVVEPAYLRKKIMGVLRSALDKYEQTV
jgi:predicted DNA-binding transcriptional regulator YafY